MPSRRTSRSTASRPSASGRRKRSTTRASSPRRARTLYRKLQFTSRRALQRSLAGVRYAASDVGSLLDAANSESATRLSDLTHGLITRRMRVGEARDVVLGTIRWAAAQGADADKRRRAVAKAFRTSGQGLYLVHGASELSADDAAAMMGAFFAEGGDMQTVGQWLAIAGREIASREAAPVVATITAPNPTVTRRAPSAQRRAAGLFDWVSDAASAVSNWLSDTASSVADAVGSVVNAVISAGKSVADAIAAAASWTAGQIGDLCRALINVGKSVAEVLSAALAKGLLAKFVAALLQIGRKISELLSWASQRIASVIRDVVAAILAAGRTIFDILSWAALQLQAVARGIVQALLDAGKTIAMIMADAVKLVATGLRAIARVLYLATLKLGEILIAISRCVVSVIRTVIEGLFMAGVTLVKMIVSICVDVVEGFRRGFFQGLIALGYAVLDLLKAALETSLAVLALAFAVVMEIFGGHRPLTPAEIAEARKVFGWSIALERVKVAVSSIPADIVNWLNGQRPFTTMYVINFASWDHVTMSSLIHELTHVWQGVISGPIYMVEALHSQFFGRGYEVTDADLAAANGDITKLEREQQAMVVQWYWERRWGGIAGDYTKYQPFAEDVYRPRPTFPFPLPIIRPLPVPLTVRRLRAPRITLRSAE